jgi:hypothetical protein
MASGRFHEHLDLGRDCFARGIEQRLGVLDRARGLSQPERVALSQLLAGAMLSQLLWWVRRGSVETPEQMDAIFHRLAWAGVGGPDAAPG